MSNDAIAHIRVGNNLFICVESAYQAARCCDSGMAGMFVKLSGKEARELGAYVTERKDWDSTKRDVLYELTLEKFKQNECIAKKLLSTGNSEITDEFLGDILMRVRSELKK